MISFSNIYTVIVHATTIRRYTLQRTGKCVQRVLGLPAVYCVEETLSQTASLSL